MNTQEFNLFIVDDNPLLVTRLRSYLDARFGSSLNISSFYTAQSILEEVDEDTNIVILDYDLGGKSGNDILKSIKKINPKTEVIMLTSNEEISAAIDSFQNGASDYVIKGLNSGKQITSLIYNIITYPVKLMGKEFGINKYVVIFLFIFLVLGVGAYFTLKYLP